MTRITGAFRCLLLSGLMLLAAAGVSPALAQQSREINIGSMHYTMNEGLTADGIGWPRYQPWTDQTMLTNHGVILGVRRNWTDATGVSWPVQIAQVAHNKTTNISEVFVPVSGAFKRVFRNPYPTKVIDEEDWTRNFDKSDPVDPSIPSDAMAYVKMNGWPAYGMGLQLERWAYAFANDEHDDYIIMEYVVTNTSSEVRNDVYLGLTAQTNGNGHYPGDIWGNYYGATYEEYVAGDATADSMRVWYSWDAGPPQAGVDPRGHPQSIYGLFQEPQYMTYSVLHADTSPADESDDPSKPIKAGWSQRQLSPDLTSADQDDVFNFLTTPWDPSNPGDYATTVKGGWYRILRPGWDVRNSSSQTEQEKSVLFSFGPYQLQPGEDFRVVVAFAGGQIPHRLAIDAGRAYKNGNTAQLGLIPLPNDVHDLDGNLIASAGEILSRDKKDQILDMGQFYAFQNASKARRTWLNSTVRKGEGVFNVEFAPAAPSLTVTSENDQIRIAWGREAEQDNQADPIAGYRIYRDFKRDINVTIPTDTTHILIADETDLPAGTYEYIDSLVVRGEQYYYYVTAVTVDGVESNAFQNRTGTSSTRSDEAVAPTRSPDPNWKENIVVVPNPYHLSGAANYGNFNRRLNFLNAPPYANIHIYTMTGDKVQTLRHTGNTGDEDWQRQDTFSTMEIVSGIYIYVVEELDGPNGNPTGEQAIGKFVIIK